VKGTLQKIFKILDIKSDHLIVFEVRVLLAFFVTMCTRCAHNWDYFLYFISPSFFF